MIYRLSESTALEISDDIISHDITSNPKIYIYDHVDSVNTNNVTFEIFQGDDGTLNRIRGFSYKHENVLLTPTPYFYYDDLYGLDYHNTHTFSDLITATPTSTIDYRKCRLLFTNGYIYNPSTNAGVSLKIYVKSNTKTTNLVQLVDLFDDSLIQPTMPVLFENQTFNAAIDFEMLHISNLFNVSATDINELKQTLFNNKLIDTMFVEFSSFSEDDIDTFTSFGKEYKRLTFPIINTQNVPMTPVDDGTFCELIYENRVVSMEIKHTLYDAESFLTQRFASDLGETLDVYFDVTIHQLNVSNEYLDSSNYRFKTLDNIWNKFEFIPVIVSNDVDHIIIECKGIITGANALRIEKSGTILITDASELMEQHLNITLSTENVYNKVEKIINTITPSNDVPEIITINKPHFIFSQESNSLLLLPVDQTIQISYDVSELIQSTKLKIGTLSYSNTSAGTNIFSIGSESYYANVTQWFLTTSDDVLITYGDIYRNISTTQTATTISVNGSTE